MDNSNFHISEKHYLEGQDIEYIDCPKNSQKFSREMPDTIVLHYTAGRNGKSAANYLAKDNVKASAHLVIDRDGTIFQLVPFDTIAWHAGRSSWKGRSGLNKYSIGIEIDNAGVLSKSGNKYVAWFGKKYDAEDVIEATHRNESQPKYWHLYTEKQIEVVEELCELLLNKYTGIQNILGHEEIAPGRKQDPGPAFPLDQLRKHLLNDRDEDKAAIDAQTGEVAVDYLNIRELPGRRAPLVSSPLSQGTQLKIHEKHGEWYRVETQIEGWVSAEYINFS
ncbi:MAG: N-acetylmuramoyl-L-alanine amidase [Bacteroidota bacterium]